MDRNLESVGEGGFLGRLGQIFDRRFFSREAAKEKDFYGFSALLFQEISSAMEFRLLRVLRVRNAFAPHGGCTRFFECVRASASPREAPRPLQRCLFKGASPTQSASSIGRADRVRR